MVENNALIKSVPRQQHRSLFVYILYDKTITTIKSVLFLTPPVG